MEENIHNDFFINIIKNKKNAVDFLNGVLPKDISDKIDFNIIDFDDTSYIQNRFKELFSDIVIKTKIKKKDCDIYILIEHKSSLPESDTLFLQILSYIYSMFEKDFNDKKDIRIIIPLVFYHGEKRWDIPKYFNDMFDIDSDIKKYLIDFSYLLFDTSNYDIDKSDIFHKNLLLTSSMIALKTAFNKNDIDSVIKIIENLNSLGLLTDFKRIEIFLVYILRTKNINEKKIIELITNYNPEGGRYMLTLENYFVEKGIEQGIEQGIEKGEYVKALKDAKKMKELNLSVDIIQKVTGLSIEEIERL